MIDFVSLGSNILNGFLDLVINFIVMVCNVVLMPIDALLSVLIPSYSDFTASIVASLSVATEYVGYCLDSLGLYSSTLYLLAAYITAKLTIPAATWVLKLALSWYDTLKL